MNAVNTMTYEEQCESSRAAFPLSEDPGEFFSELFWITKSGRDKEQLRYNRAKHYPSELREAEFAIVRVRLRQVEDVYLFIARSTCK